MNPEIHREYPEQFLVPTPSVAKDLMSRDIMSSEPRHWMLFGQLVMPVQYCAEAWICRDLEIWEPGNLESWNPTKIQPQHIKIKAGP